MELLLAGVLALAAGLAGRAAAGLLLFPVRGDGVKASLTLRLQAGADERALRGARWLVRAGGIDVHIVDEGMDDETRAAVERVFTGVEITDGEYRT